MNAKATLYLEPKVYRAYKVRAAQQDRTVSDLVNEVLKREIEGRAPSTDEAAKPFLTYDGPMGFPVAHGVKMPKDWAFNREDLYD